MRQMTKTVGAVTLAAFLFAGCATWQAEPDGEPEQPEADVEEQIPPLSIPEDNLLGDVQFSEEFYVPDEEPEDGAFDTQDRWLFLEFGDGDASYEQTDTGLELNIADGGSNSYSVQVLQAPIEIVRGGEYEIELVAWAEDERDIEVKVGGSAGRGWTPYNAGKGAEGGQLVSLTTEPTKHSLSFTMMEETDPQARFEFCLGLDDTDVHLAAVSLRQSGEVADLGELVAEDVDVDAYLDTEWEEVWSDEFTGDDIDRDVWTFEIGNGHEQGIPGWGNAERQYYTDEEQNAFIRDDKLVIRALEDERSDEYGEYPYTSARMITQDGFTTQYGRIDVRAKLPYGQGIWPAIWMLGANIGEVGWPACGEIDIMELVGHKPDTVHGTIHGPGYSGGGGIGDSYSIDNEFSEDFHVFSIIWDEDVIIWLVDDEPFHQVSADYVDHFYGADWVFNQEFFFILNVAVGGHWPGYPDDTTEFPQEMEVDYVRVFDPVE